MKSFRSHYGTGVDSASNRIEYQEYFLGRCIRLTTYHNPVPLSRNLRNLTSSEPSGPVQACNGTALPLPLPYLQCEVKYGSVYIHEIAQHGREHHFTCEVLLLLVNWKYTHLVSSIKYHCPILTYSKSYDFVPENNLYIETSFAKVPL